MGSFVPQGMTKAANNVEDSPTLVRLWVHEVLRVFYDRLVCDEDRLWTGRLLEGLTDTHFKERLGRLLGVSSSSDGSSGGGGSRAGGAAAAAGAGAGAGGALGDADLMAGLRGLMFGDFLNTGGGEPKDTPGALVVAYALLPKG